MSRPLRRAALALSALLASCTVSVFGSDEITIIGAQAPGGEGGQACSETDDARRAREDPERCVAHCAIGAGGELAGGCSYLEASEERDGLVTLDMSEADGVVIELEVCDPSGVVFQIADSPTADADGGDGGTSSHDASVLLEGTTLHVRASEGSGIDPSEARNYVAATGCATRTLVIADRIAYMVDAERGLCGDAMFRIDPPDDTEGAPDSLFHIAIGSAVDGSATGGEGFRSAALCFF